MVNKRLHGIGGDDTQDACLTYGATIKLLRLYRLLGLVI